MNSVMDEVRALLRSEKYNEALSWLEEAEKRLISYPEILVLKAMCVQLGSGDSKYELEDVENMYKEALRIDQEFVAASLELAWFYLNVYDNAQRAKPLFEKAVDSYRVQITEAVIGMAKCLAETASKEEALSYLEKMTMSALSNEEIEVCKSEIEDMY